MTKASEKALRLTMGWGVATSCGIALLQGFGSISQRSVVELVIVGASAAIIAVYEHGWYQAPFPIGTPVRGVVILALIWGVMGGLGYLAWPPPMPSSGSASGCVIAPNTQPLDVTPMPTKATDQQLLSEALVMVESLEHLAKEWNSTAKSGKQTPEQLQQTTCALLQEYETNLRIPVIAVEGAILDRLPIDDREPSQSRKTMAEYLHPKDTMALLDVGGDLLMISGRLEKISGIEAAWPTTRWILPIEHPVDAPVPPWEPDLTDPPVQQFSSLSTTVELRLVSGSVGFVLGGRRDQADFDYILTAKSNEPVNHDHRVRVTFENPLSMVNVPLLPSHTENVTIGSNYIEMTVGKSCEIQTSGQLIIAGVRKLGP